MRIVGGQFSGRSLVAPNGLATRPTSDKVRQAVFNILFSRGAAMDKVLDLFAGSGALGFEAISRGALEVVFVELDKNAVVAIEKNAKALDVSAQVKIHHDKVAAWAKRLRPDGPRFDLVFIDPPYADKGAQKNALAAASEVLAEHGLVVLEHDRMDELPPTLFGGETNVLCRVDQRQYGQTAVSFYERDHSDPKGDSDG